MKDLYRRINLASQTDDRAAIERALESVIGQDKSILMAARRILLDPNRKPVYDRTHAVVKRVGQLRANLGLLRSPNWLVSDCSDFDATPTREVSPLRSRGTSQSRTHAETLSHGDNRWLIAGIVALLLCVFAAILGNTSPSRQLSEASAPPDASSSVSPQAPSTPNKPRPGAEARADKVRELVIKRLKKFGKVPDAVTVNTTVQKLMQSPELSLPDTGVLTQSFSSIGVAPLEIRTRSGSNYYVKIVDWNTKADVVTAFIHGGQHFEILVPLGSYQIRYACGNSWYGPILDFGEGASYSMCDDRFDFTRTSDGYRGYTVELILQQNGNLQTSPMSPDEF